MPKKILATCAVFLAIGIVVFGVGTALSASVPSPVSEAAILPQKITEQSPCPATGCASGSCHGFDDVPQPDGEHEMICPEAGCASVECHAWDALRGRYHQASDASLNVWILMPVVLAVGLVLVARKVK